MDAADNCLAQTGTGRSPIGAIVLAGGQSARLGFDKALLRVNGVPLVQWLPGRLASLFSPVAVVVDRPRRYAIPYPQVTDAMSNCGPLAGIAAGLQATSAPAVFVCACDMPLVRPALLQLLLSMLEGHDLVIPQRNGRLEPLCAIYASSCLPVIQRLLLGGRLRASGVAGEVRTRILLEKEWRDIDPEGDSFLNINTPVDLVWMQERAARYGLTLCR